jgi:hypothetical protein
MIKMSEEARGKAKSALLTFYRSTSWIAILAIALNMGVWKSNIESRVFDSPEEVEGVRNVVKTHMTEIEVYKEILRITMLEKETAIVKEDIKQMKASLERIEDQLGK